MATRIVQNIARKSVTGEVLANATVTVQPPQGTTLFTPTGEVIGKSYLTTDDTGLWQAELDVLDTGYWSVREAPGVIHAINPPAGDPAVPVWLEACLVDDPTAPAYPPITQIVDDALDALFANTVTA